MRDVEHGLYIPKDEPVTLGAPYHSTGVVVRHKSSWRDWSILPLTYRQMFYVFVMNSLGAAIISGAANFGVACAMYRSTSDPIRIWIFDDNTIAGDMGVTVILQQLATMLVTSTLCNHDVRHGVPALARPWPPLLHFPANPCPSGSYLGTDHPARVAHTGPAPMGNATNGSKLSQFLLWFVRAMCTGSERNAFLLRGLTLRQRIERLLWTALQGLWMAVLTFWWYWPIAIAIVAPIYEHKNMQDTWIPQIIKLLFGGIMGLLTNPIMALMALGAECNVRREHPDLAIWREGEQDRQVAHNPDEDLRLLREVKL